MPSQLLPPSWQALQFAVTPPWTCAVVGAGVANPVPGGISDAFAATAVDGIDDWWHVSQAVPVGMCEDGPGGLTGGITVIFVMPAKPVTEGPWHSAQVVRPAWLIVEFEKRAPSLTGVAATLEPGPTWQTSHDCVVGT
jgi:hypothetical protein